MDRTTGQRPPASSESLSVGHRRLGSRGHSRSRPERLRITAVAADCLCGAAARSHGMRICPSARDGPAPVRCSPLHAQRPLPHPRPFILLELDMNDTARTITVRLLTGSLGPHDETVITIPAPEGAALPPLVIEDPSPHYPGAWRRVSGSGDVPTYTRLARVVAP